MMLSQLILSSFCSAIEDINLSTSSVYFWIKWADTILKECALNAIFLFHI